MNLQKRGVKQLGEFSPAPIINVCILGVIHHSHAGRNGNRCMWCSKITWKIPEQLQIHS